MALPPRSVPRQIAGVCAGLSRGYDYDLRLVRVLFILTGPISVYVYLVLWMIMPPRPSATEGHEPYSSSHS